MLSLLVSSFYCEYYFAAVSGSPEEGGATLPAAARSEYYRLMYACLQVIIEQSSSGEFCTSSDSCFQHGFSGHFLFLSLSDHLS